MDYEIEIQLKVFSTNGNQTSFNKTEKGAFSLEDEKHVFVPELNDANYSFIVQYYKIQNVISDKILHLCHEIILELEEKKSVMTLL